MAKRFLLFLVLLGLMAFGPASAGANLINFDDLTTGLNIDGVHLGPTSPDGCVITSNNGDTVVVSDMGVGFRSAPNAVTNGSFITNNPMTITFDVPRGLVALTGGDRGGDQDRFYVDAYDAGNNLLLTIDTGVFGGNAIDPLLMVDYYRVTFDNAVNFTGHIKKIVIRDAINAGIGIDDLEYCRPVPIPGAVWLLGSGLLGLLGLRRRLIG